MRSGSTCINDSDRRETVGTTYRLLEVGDEVVPVLVLLETTEGHLGTGNELLGVLEVVELDKTVSCAILRLISSI